MSTRHARPRASAVLLALLVVAGLASCGGDEEAQASDVAQPTQACAEAFAEVEESVTEREGPGESEETALDAEAEEADPAGEPARLGALAPTLEVCEGFEDWMAGARSAPAVLPERMDPETALDMLCRAVVDSEMYQIPTGTAPCAALPDDADGPAS